MSPTLLRSLVPVTLSSLALVFAAACGGSSTGGSGSTIKGDGGTPTGCTPGTTKPASDGCNTCTCSASGAWQCTLLGCSACSPGQTTNDGCNSCSCVNGEWACTDRACPPPVCKDGETMMQDCNTCSCSNGTWACTKKACPPPACENGTTKYDGCNSCSCMNGQWACTARACPPAQDGGSAPKGCGGWLGNTCTASEYCAYKEGQLCGAADASSVCQPRPTVCDTVYSPVCGCDQKTYSNECTAAVAGTGVYTSGECVTATF